MRAFFNVLVLTFVFSTGFASIQCLDAQERQAPNSAKPNEALLDVRDGRDSGYYLALRRDLRKEIGRAALSSDGDEYLAKARLALRRINWNLAFNCKGATKTIVDEAFRDYCASASADSDVEELKSVLDRLTADPKPDEERIDRVAGLIDLARIDRATSADDSGAVDALIDEYLERISNDPKFAKRLSSVGARFQKASAELGERFASEVETRFGESEDKELRRAALSVRGKERCANLVGSEALLEGLSTTGKEFDPETLRGKVVLVLFFTTENRACMETMRKFAEFYVLYRADGFELVGYCVDSDPKKTETFNLRYPYSWTTISRKLSLESEQKEYVDLVSYYGVDSTPFAILIGRNGKVIKTNVKYERAGGPIVEALRDSKE